MDRVGIGVLQPGKQSVPFADDATLPSAESPCRWGKPDLGHRIEHDFPKQRHGPVIGDPLQATGAPLGIDCRRLALKPLDRSRQAGSPEESRMPPLSRRLFGTSLAASLAMRGHAATGALGSAEAETARRLAGTLIIVGFSGTEPGHPGVTDVARQLRDGTIGGVILMGRNIRDAAQVRMLTRHLRAATDAPTLIATDQEGGQVSRLPTGTSALPWASARRLGQRSEADLGAYYAPRAQRLAALGITLNLAPVVDLARAHSPAIGARNRSFSGDPDSVARSARAFVQAHRNAGVLSALKHFPGHGSAREDSHRTLPDVSRVWSDDELRPFADLIQSGFADTIMMAHLDHPRFSDLPGRPASLSARAYRTLRQDLGFTGVAISDDLQMAAVASRFSEDSAAVAALVAGCDLLLFSGFRNQDATLGPRVNRAVAAAIATGLLPRARLVESVLRVAQMTARLKG